MHTWSTVQQLEATNQIYTLKYGWTESIAPKTWMYKMHIFINKNTHFVRTIQKDRTTLKLNRLEFFHIGEEGDTSGNKGKKV